MEIIIRKASEKDLPTILDIYNDAIINTTAVYDYIPHTLGMRKNWLEDKIKNNIPVLVAETEQQVVGFTSYGAFRAWAAYKYSVEHSVYVHQNFRGKGVAKKLLEVLIEEINQRQIHTIIAGIDAANTISIHLHKQLGFEEAGYIKEAGYKFGRWLDLLFMQLILKNHLHPTED